MIRKNSKGLQRLDRDKNDKFGICLRVPLKTAEKLNRLSIEANQTRSAYVADLIAAQPETGEPT